MKYIQSKLRGTVRVVPMLELEEENVKYLINVFGFRSRVETAAFLIEWVKSNFLLGSLQ